MNSNQFRKWLAERGATFKPGNGGHLKVFLNGRQTVCLCTVPKKSAAAWNTRSRKTWA
ncbi:MAG: hypothetical protein ABI132_05655 [Rhodanobacteraceae bacterium]